YGRGVEAASSRGDEQRVLGAARELRPRLVQIPRQTVGRLLAERDDAFLASLSEHAHVLLLEVHVSEVQRDGLVAAQSGGIDELDERPVPQRQRVAAVERLERALDLALPRGIRQAAPASRREGGFGNACRPEREAEEAANRRELPADRRRGELPRPRAAEL